MKSNITVKSNTRRFKNVWNAKKCKDANKETKIAVHFHGKNMCGNEVKWRQEYSNLF